MAAFGLFLLAALLLSIYDFRHRIIPNWATVPIALLGVVLHFPAVYEVWIGSFILILFACLGGGRIGSGDVKLWLAFFWILPTNLAGAGTLIGFSVMLLTSLAQIAYLKSRKITLSASYPAAWRVFVSVLVVLIYSYIEIHYAQPL